MKNAFFFLLLLIPVMSGAQDMSQSVLGSAGGDYISDQLSVTWTIGEVVTETFESDNYTLNQGFHQGNLVVTRIEEDQSLDFQIKTYPNPVKDILIIETENPGFEYQIVNIQGSVVSNGNVYSSSSEIDFTSFPAGSYFLQVEKQHSYKIIKN